jgi:CHAD domain-containing protein
MTCVASCCLNSFHTLAAEPANPTQSMASLLASILAWQPKLLAIPSKKPMALDLKSVQKPFRKLGKLLKKLPDPPAPEDVHDVRTQTRRIEAVVCAFELNDRKTGNNLVKSLKPIRQAAGVVRDSDVLTDLAASLDPSGDGDCRLQLIEHLAARRKRGAAKMYKRMSAIEKTARSLLKACRKLAEDGLDEAPSGNAQGKRIQERRQKSARSMAISLEIEQELRDWPKITSKNIHPFRLKVKELRNVLQLGQNSDSKFVAELGNVKDEIGLWHDWNELVAISSKVLDHGAGCPIAAQIRSRTRGQLKKALESANALRARYLRSASGRGPRRKGIVTEIHPALVKATSRLAS